MPATNPDWSQLTPTVGDTTSSHSRDYLSSWMPAWSPAYMALTFLSLIIILRFFLRRGGSYLQKPPSSYSKNPRRHSGGYLDQHQQPLDQPSLPSPWLLNEKYFIHGNDLVDVMKSSHVTFAEPDGTAKKSKLSIDPSWGVGSDSVPRPLIARPPPAPPLTPPELSTAVFTFEDRPQAQGSFLDQPNPDYMSATTSVSQSAQASPGTPRRRSYNKTLPIGIPISQKSSTASQIDAADLTFSSSSFPPTSPLLPPAPPDAQPATGLGNFREIDVKGEIISVLDREGAGWTRHTRVYGGGVCLACAASGGNHEGGFYGATVSPEEMR